MAKKTEIREYKKSKKQSEYEKKTFIDPLRKLVPQAKSRRERGIKLPKYISFKKDLNKLFINIEEQIGYYEGKEIILNPTMNNMQTDNAAFEGWAVCMKAWFPEDIDKIELSWDTPHDIDEKNNGWCHYRRFLYRVLRFSEQYDWFDISKKNRKEVNEFKQQLIDLRNNNFNENPKPKTNYSQLNETTVEYILTTTLSEAIMDKFSLDFVDRQFPVGVKSKGNKFFTSNASAIDLWGTKENVLTIIELKYNSPKSKNIKVGIISELFMYSCIMRDILSGVINRPQKTPNNNEEIFYQQRAKYKEINACMLSNEFHPLVNNDSVIDILNNYSKVDGKATVKFNKVGYELRSTKEIDFL